MNRSRSLQSDTDLPNAMLFSSKRAEVICALIILVIGTCFSQSPPKEDASAHSETLVVLPFETHGLSREDGLLLVNRFTEVMRESNRFEVILRDSAQRPEGWHNPRSLAEKGKALGVQKIVHVSVVHRDKLFVLQIRMVNVDDAALLYAERVDYSGEFGSLLSDVIPEQARKLTQAHLDAKTPWAKAAFLFGACLGAILWIFWHFRRKDIPQMDSSARTKD
jgi:TolB-like protein